MDDFIEQTLQSLKLLIVNCKLSSTTEKQEYAAHVKYIENARRLRCVLKRKGGGDGRRERRLIRHRAIY